MRNRRKGLKLQSENLSAIEMMGRSALYHRFTRLQQLVQESPSLFEFTFPKQGLRLARQCIVLPLFGQTLGELVVLTGPFLCLANFILQLEVLFVEEFIEPLQGLGV
jgi:hypothetical protein